MKFTRDEQVKNQYGREWRKLTSNADITQDKGRTCSEETQEPNYIQRLNGKSEWKMVHTNVELNPSEGASYPMFQP